MGSLAVGLLLVALLAGLLLIWRRPFLALGFLVAGMAIHNFILMVLLRLGTPGLLVRAFQTWKEAILALLLLMVLLQLYRLWRAGTLPRLVISDWLAIAFALLACVYLLVPQQALGGHSNLAQRLLAFRAAIFLPLLYLVGRTFAARATERDHSQVAWMLAGSAALVGAFGLVELWLLPTRIWVDWGENLFNAWLGFSYRGPGNLPDNFFQTLPGGPLLLRRMVSTYLSPLGIAYTAILVLPVAVVLVDRARGGGRRGYFAGVVLALSLAGILFSVTRLAIGCLVIEAAILAVVMKERWVGGLTLLLALLAVGMFFVYPKVGPVVDRNLNPARAGYTTSIVSASDPSAQEHSVFLIGDLALVVQHPLGVGLGSAVFRYGNGNRAGESAVLSVFVDMGVVGGLVYLGMYLMALLQGYRVYRALNPETILTALPLVAAVAGFALFPITVTSDLWGATSVTFLFWWAAGHVASIASRRAGEEIQPAPLRRPI
jgi:hypothetical protein